MLELQLISWTAPGGSQVVRDVSFSVPEGKLTVITGPNGGGKTTLAKLIAGIETPDSGKILLDGQDITPLDVTQRARAGVSFAFQQPVRFTGFTVRRLLELAAGKPLPASGVCEMLGRVGLCGREYLDREVDATLSGGEKQRISIARAMLKNAPIVILDEATASVDPENEHLIQQALSALTKGKTILTIAHRLATIQSADQILVVEDGRIVQRGTHDELMAQGGLYRRFIEIRVQAEGWRLA